MTRLLFLSVLLAWTTLLCGQFAPAPALPTDTTALYQELQRRIERIDPSSPQEYHAKIREINEERFTDLRDEIRDSTFLFHPELTGFLTALFTEIAAANDLKLEPLVLLRRSQIPNAASYGGGIFTVNLGLFQSLESQDELAFVFCHEVAHDRLHHLRERVHAFCERQVSLEGVQRKLRRNLRESRRNSLLLGARETIYGSFRLQRRNELEADSLGLVYYGKLDYDRQAARTALNALDYHGLLSLYDVDIAGLLQTEGYPLKEKWFEAPEQMFGGSFGSDEAPEGFWASDSVSTHPAMAARREEMAVQLPTEDIDTTKKQTRHPYGELVNREMIRAQTECGFPGLAVVNGLELLARFPEDATARQLVGEALLATYRSIESHDFDEAVPPEGYFWEENARLTIRMLHNMRQSELRRFARAWIREHVPAEGTDGLPERAEEYFINLE